MIVTKANYKGEWYNVDATLTKQEMIDSFKVIFPELGPRPFCMKSIEGDEVHYYLAKTPLHREKRGNHDFFSNPEYPYKSGRLKDSYGKRPSVSSSTHHTWPTIHSNSIQGSSITSAHIDMTNTRVKDMSIVSLQTSIINQMEAFKDTHPYIVLGEYADKGGYAAYVGKEASIVATNEELGVHTVRMKEDESEWVIRQKDIKEKGV